jgi:hypothetical protein
LPRLSSLIRTVEFRIRESVYDRCGIMRRLFDSCDDLAFRRFGDHLSFQVESILRRVQGSVRKPKPLKNLLHGTMVAISLATYRFSRDEVVNSVDF